VAVVVNLLKLALMYKDTVT